MPGIVRSSLLDLLFSWRNLLCYTPYSPVQWINKQGGMKTNEVVCRKKKETRNRKVNVFNMNIAWSVYTQFTNNIRESCQNSPIDYNSQAKLISILQ